MHSHPKESSQHSPVSSADDRTEAALHSGTSSGLGVVLMHSQLFESAHSGRHFLVSGGNVLASPRTLMASVASLPDAASSPPESRRASASGDELACELSVGPVPGEPLHATVSDATMTVPTVKRYPLQLMCSMLAAS
jgi:hypothetical protein